MAQTALRLALMLTLVVLGSNGAWGGDTMNLLQVTDFGATPDDGKDDTAALRAAFEKARETGADGVAFAPGRYDFHADPEFRGHHVTLGAANLKDFLVEGNGAELIYHGITQPFSMAACEDLTIQNLTIDWEKPIISVGDAAEVKDAYFEVDVYDEYPVVGGEKVDSVMDYDRETGLPRRHGCDAYWSVDRTELVAPQRLRVYTRFPFNLELGAPVVLRHQTYGYNGFSFHGCKDVVVRDVTIYHVPGMAFTAGQCHNVTLERCKVLIKPDTRRYISANADGSHFGGCTGTVTIKDCVFDGQGDDAINAKAGLYLTVKEKLDDRTVMAQHNLEMQDVRDPGDVMELTPPDTLIPYGTATVATCEWLPEGKTHKVVFEEPFPERLAVGDLLGNATRTAKFRISGCTFSRNRARGILLQSRDAVVEGCVFKDVTSGGIWVLAEVTHFYECIPARDIIIRGNIFENCNYGGPLGDAVIGAFAYLKGFAPPPQPGVFKNITIEGNVIRQADNCGIYLAGVEGARITGNIIEKTGDMPTFPHGVNAIFVRSSRDIHFSGNVAMPQSQGSQSEAIYAEDPDLPAQEVVREGNLGF